MRELVLDVKVVRDHNSEEVEIQSCFIADGTLVVRI